VGAWDGVRVEPVFWVWAVGAVRCAGDAGVVCGAGVDGVCGVVGNQV
jgi:hypothetical protein